MHIIIEDKIVSENVHGFIALLRKEEARREKSGGVFMEKKYPAFLHRKTGRLIFVDAFKEQVHFEKKEWKPLFFEYSYDPLNETFHAAVFEGEKEFHFGDLQAHAVIALRETMHILNGLSDRVKGSGSDLMTKLRDLCSLQIEVGSIQKGRGLLVSAWHGVDRVGAEKMLEGQLIGTFLFREDYFAKLLAEQLTEERSKKIKCITLSILDAKDHISEHTLVHIDHQWRVYNDIDFCDGKGYQELEVLLENTFKDELKTPLYHNYENRNHENRHIA